MKQNIALVPIKENDREWFIKDIQKAFTAAATEEYGLSEGEVIPEKDIEESMDAKGAETYYITANGKIVGGTVVVNDKKRHRNFLDLLFINQAYQSKGIGLAAWKKIEEMYPETMIWETRTPYFEKRNIHFYVNKCGFKAVEFFHSHHMDPNMYRSNVVGGKCFFRFEKEVR
jgi:predicted acetyltransferase